jgi:hypothetical protein
VFGSGDLVCLASVLAGMLLARAGWWWAAGVALGAGIAFAPQVLLAAPLLLAAAARSRPAAIPAALGIALGLLPFLLAGGWAFAAPAAPGLGLPNVLVYFGADRAIAWWWLPALAALAASTALARRFAALPEPERCLAVAGLLVAALWLLPAASPHALGAPLALLALAIPVHSTPDS